MTKQIFFPAMTLATTTSLSLSKTEHEMDRSLKCIVIAVLCCLENIAYGLPVIDKPFTPQRDASEITDKLGQFIPPAMHQAKIPGLSIAIVRDGEVVYKQAFGLDNYWAEHPMTTDKIFEVASLSKPVTAYGVLKLVDQGLIDLDGPVTRYLPSAPADVTLRHALTHTSALQHIGHDGYAAGDAPGNTFSYSAAGYLLSGDVIEQISQQSLADYLATQVLAPLGMTQSGYGDFPSDKTRMAKPHSSTSIPLRLISIAGVGISLVLVLLTWISRWLIGVIKKSPYKKSSYWWKRCIAIGFSIALILLIYFMRANAILYALVAVPVLVALFLSILLLSAKRDRQIAGQSNLFRKRSFRVTLGLVLMVLTIFVIWQNRPLPIDFRGGSHASYAGLRATASDMALFLDELMAPTHIDEKLVQDMLQPQVQVNPHNAWGLGIGIQTQSKQKIIWHWGINYPGYQALMVGYPEHRLGIVVLMNGGVMLRRSGGFSGRGLELARNIVAEASGGEHHDYWIGIQ